MVKIRIKMLSLLKDVFGEEEIVLDIPAGMSLGELINELSRKYVGFNKVRDTIEIIVLVNGEKKDMNYMLKNGDEVALMPPASGGM